MTKHLKLFSATPSAFFFAFILFSLILLHTASLQAAPKSTDSNQQRQQIAKLTAELNRLLQSYRQASSDQQPQIAQQLETIASERQQLLSEVVSDDPQTILKYALPAKAQKQFPENVQQKFEQWVHAQGELEIYFEDYEKAENNRLRYFLKQDSKRFELAVAGDKMPATRSGLPVFVEGVMLNKGNKPVIATSDEQLMLAAGGSGDPNTSTAPDALDYTFGEQRTAVFLVNFQDNPGEKPWTKAEIHDRFFTEVSQFFLETSYQQTWLTGDVYGWYTLPINSTDTCSSLDIGDAADAAAIANNVDLSQYDRYVYVFPTSSCGWSGIATVGGLQTRAWVNNAPYSKVPAHEMGHNLGLLHSQGLNCQGDVLNTNCAFVTYGDQLDTMGAKPGHYNAYQKERLGWLNQSNTPPLLTVDQAGSYAIELMETTTANAKALKIFKDIDPANGESRWYYVEFRQPVGEDQFISYSLDEANITNGVTIRLGTDHKADSSFLLDMTPDSDTSISQHTDLKDAALVSGKSYTDADTGLTITTEYTDSQTATVNVSYGGGSGGSACTHANPAITVSPSQSQWVKAGSQVNFTLSVTNQDNSSCSTSTFVMSAALPAGWSANSPQLSLQPGQSGSAVVSVTSATDAADGFYDIVLTASNQSQPSYSADTTATYVVSNGSSNSAPDAVNDNVTMSSTAPIVINVLSNDSDPDADPIYISALGSAAKGDVSVNADGTVLYTPAKRFKDTDSFSYTISDGEANDTATVNLTLQASSGGTDTSGGGTGGNGNGGGGKGGGKPAK